MNRRHVASPLAWSLASVACVALAAPAAAQEGDRYLPGASTEAAVCDDLLVTHRPDGSTGSAATVAITSQALERGVEGWAMVGWTAAAGTSIREVQVVAADGVSSQPGADQGVAGPASEIRFCGTVAAGSAPDDAAQDDVATADVATADASPTSPGPASTGTATNGPAAPDGNDHTTTLSFLGATIGLLVGSVVLLMSRGARRSGGVAP